MTHPNKPKKKRKEILEAYVVSAELLEGVPIEYQAKMYEKLEKERLSKKYDQAIKEKEELKEKLKALSHQLKSNPSKELEQQIKKLKKAIKKVPQPKKNWSPVLSGSFESNSK